MSKKTIAATVVQPYHYFGSTAFNWAVGDTRAEVLENLARSAGDSIVKANVKNNGGLYAWTTRVDAPRDTRYDIQNYVPVGVKYTESREDRIQNVKGHVIPQEASR